MNNKKKTMNNWVVQYRNKGESQIRTETVNVHFTEKRQVQKWWYSVRPNKEFINAKLKDK
jgi:hypothetical protein